MAGRAAAVGRAGAAGARTTAAVGDRTAVGVEAEVVTIVARAGEPGPAVAVAVGRTPQGAVAPVRPHAVVVTAVVGRAATAAAVGRAVP